MYVYILYSQKLDRFYIGQTALPPEQRLAEHNSEKYKQVALPIVT